MGLPEALTSWLALALGVIMIVSDFWRFRRSAVVHWLLLGISPIAIGLTSCSKLKDLTEPPANADTVALAEHLTRTGAKMYGTYWCPYCNKQEELFKDAVSKVQIVECDPQGDNAQPQLCAQAQVSSYPTWEIQGKLYLGMRSLEELAQLSGYQGSMNFQSRMP